MIGKTMIGENEYRELSLYKSYHSYKERFSIDGDLLIGITYAKITKADIYIVFKKNDFVKEFSKTLDALYGIPITDTIHYDRLAGTSFENGGVISRLIFVFPIFRRREVIQKNLFTVRLRRMGFDKIIYLGLDQLRAITNMTHKWVDAGRREYYLDHLDEIIAFASLLNDENSSQVLYEYIKAYITNGIYCGDEIETNNKYWYGLDKEDLYRHLDDESWVNCGAYVGDTIFSYLSNGFSYKKILAFEGSKENFKKLVNNIADLGKKTDISKIKLYNSFIDYSGNHMKVLKEEKCTLLNADIEGYELELLKSMTEIIKRDRPVIAVCLYHKKEDVVEIPQYLYSIVDNYTYKLRKYTSWIHDTKRCYELVLYAIPKERNV